MASLTCPRCAAPFDRVAAGSSVPLVACPQCSLPFTAPMLAELAYLADLATWTQQRRDYLAQTAHAGIPAVPLVAPVIGQPAVGPMAAAAAAPTGSPGGAAWPTTTGPMPYQPSPPTSATSGSGVRGLFLAAGVFALVVAALIFTAFAWNALGDWGRFSLLIGAGAFAFAVAALLHARVPATALAVSVVGSLFITIACVFLLVVDPVGDGIAATVIVVAIAIGGLAAALAWQRRVQRAGATISALAAVGLLIITTLTYPARADLDVSALLWCALWFLAWAVLLHALDLFDDLAPWAWFGAVGAVLGVYCGVGEYIDGSTWNQPYGSALVAAVLVGVALVVLVIDRLTGARWWTPPVVAATLIVSALGVAILKLDIVAARPWIALAMFVAALGVAATIAHVVQVSGRRRPIDLGRPGAAVDASAWLCGLLAAAALAVALAGGTPSAARGVLVASLSLVVMVVLAIAARMRRVGGYQAAGVVGAYVIVVLWSLIVIADTSSFARGVPTSVPTALVIVGFGAMLIAPLVGQAAGASASGVGFALVGTEWLWQQWDFTDWALAPEMHGILLAIPVVVMVLMLVLGQRVLPSAVSIGLPLTFLLLPTTFAMLDGVFEPAHQIENYSTATVARLIGLLVLGLVCATAGARFRLAGLFWPGLVLIVLIAVTQIVEWADSIPVWLSLTIVGVLLLVVGARWEWVQRTGGRTARWAGTLR